MPDSQKYPLRRFFRPIVVPMIHKTIPTPKKSAANIILDGGNLGLGCGTFPSGSPMLVACRPICCSCRSVKIHSALLRCWDRFVDHWHNNRAEKPAKRIFLAIWHSSACGDGAALAVELVVGLDRVRASVQSDWHRSDRSFLLLGVP